MNLRRAAGFIAGLLLIPKLVTGTSVTCSQHGEKLATAEATGAAPEHQHDHHDAGKNTTPVDRHSASDCCPAMNSCANSIAIKSGGLVLDDRSSRTDVPSFVAADSRSRIESPDPPPPKA